MVRTFFVVLALTVGFVATTLIASADMHLVATVEEMDGSGVSGEVDISPDGDGILVSVVLAGLPEGERANHLHHGSCDDQGEVHITLDNVVADEAGDGTQTTANDEQPIDHFETGHYYAVHDEDGAVIGCGDVVAGSTDTENGDAMSDEDGTADETLPSSGQGPGPSAPTGTPATWMIGLAALGAVLLASALALRRREN